MDTWKKLRRKFVFLSIGILIVMVVVVTFSGTHKTIPKPIRNLHQVANSCPHHIADQTITPLENTKHLLVSAYIDQRVKDFDVRIISIFRRDSIQPLYCLFCCAGQLSNTTTQAHIKENSDNFGFPFATTNVLCQIPQNCSATHVSLLTQPDSVKGTAQTWLPLRNQRSGGKKEEKTQFDLTVCISNLFEFNNALQYAQTLEMYRSALHTTHTENRRVDTITATTPQSKTSKEPYMVHKGTVHVQYYTVQMFAVIVLCRVGYVRHTIHYPA